MQATYPAHEQDQFVAHFKGLLGMWLDDQRAPVPASAPLADDEAATDLGP